MKTKGFTLPETILIIIIGAVFGLMIFRFSAASNKTVSPVIWMKNEYILQKKMEDITAQYGQLVGGKNFKLEQFYTFLLNNNEFKEYIDKEKSGFLTFSKTAPNIFQANPPQDYPVTSSLLITITNEGQTLTAIFSGIGKL